MSYTELALMARMDLEGWPRDKILSFFTRPGRFVNPAVVGEVRRGKPSFSIEPATPQELRTFEAASLQQSASLVVDPISPTRIREVLFFNQQPGDLFAATEGYAEYKSIISSETTFKANVAKSMAAMANNGGGYIFFGISDDREIVGIAKGDRPEKFFDELNDIVSSKFAPLIEWKTSIVNIGGNRVGVIYIYPAERPPIISTGDYGAVKRGRVYFRYGAASREIEAEQLSDLIRKREEAAVARFRSDEKV